MCSNRVSPTYELSSLVAGLYLDTHVHSLVFSLQSPQTLLENLSLRHVFHACL